MHFGKLTFEIFDLGFIGSGAENGSSSLGHCPLPLENLRRVDVGCQAGRMRRLDIVVRR